MGVRYVVLAMILAACRGQPPQRQSAWPTSVAITPIERAAAGCFRVRGITSGDSADTGFAADSVLRLDLSVLRMQRTYARGQARGTEHDLVLHPHGAGQYGAGHHHADAGKGEHTIHREPETSVRTTFTERSCLHGEPVAQRVDTQARRRRHRELPHVGRVVMGRREYDVTVRSPCPRNGYTGHSTALKHLESTGGSWIAAIWPNAIPIKRVTCTRGSFAKKQDVPAVR